MPRLVPLRLPAVVTGGGGSGDGNVYLFLHCAAVVVAAVSLLRPPPYGNSGDVVPQQQSSANTDELTVVAVDVASSLQLLHDVRMDAMGATAAAEDDDRGDFWPCCGCCGLRNRSDAAGNSCSVCLGTSEKLSGLPPPSGVEHGVG